MMLPTALTWLVLVCLLCTGALGVASLSKWIRFRGTDFPARKVTTHVVLQCLSIAIWVAFLATMYPWLAWAAFAIITVGQVFGDLLMFSSFPARHRGSAVAGMPGGPAPARAATATSSATDTRVSYVAVAKDLLSFSRPVPALHALVGALGWFTMIVVCIFAAITL